MFNEEDMLLGYKDWCLYLNKYWGPSYKDFDTVAFDTNPLYAPIEDEI